MEDEFAGLNLVDLLDLLEPVPEPPPIPLWPETVGWLWLALILAALIGWLAWRRWQAWCRDAWRRAALAEIAAAGDDPARLAEILRRAALATHPRADVASLTGPAWLAFLDTASGGTAFTQGPGRALATSPYAPDPAPVPGLAATVADWVRTQTPAPA
jgi:hypothetical protein